MKSIMARLATISRTLGTSIVAGLVMMFGASLAGAQAPAPLHDHMEFEAQLIAPYNAEGPNDARTFRLRFSFPPGSSEQVVMWRLRLSTPGGRVIEELTGRTDLVNGHAEQALNWAGRVDKHAGLGAGIYRVRMSSFAVPKAISQLLNAGNMYFDSLVPVNDGIDRDITHQAWDIRVGQPPKPVMPQFVPMPTRHAVTARPGNSTSQVTSATTAATTPAGAVASLAPATNGLSYTVYFGNLHSQTNHSDGGGNVATCTSSQPAQSGQYSPADAFPYAKTAGLDFLMTSEHNHYFDGSSGTNTAADPATVKALYQSGLTMAANFNAANPGFLAIYGMEWGVISNGGHMNIFNARELLGWEYNASNQLLADTLTAKSDYAPLYALMKSRGWIGQFNHPDTVGQFVVGGIPLAYNADADNVMVLSEILNSSAFSNNTTETETGRSNFESAFDILLERGFHVAPASNQDNHCANWGKSYTNRTGVLIPNGLALNAANFLDALRARRVFTTLDKNSQLVLTANGHIMGERFQNSGPLTLTANFANSAGRSVSTVMIFEGVPGRNGAVGTLATTATTTTTPALGQHFYYAKITQDDGKILWSAPVWVEQVAGGDITLPTVSASVTGTSGTITFNATAGDNVGVSKVEFYVDGLLKGSTAVAPYSLAFNSTTIADGAHSLTAKAYDAAGNVGTSAVVNFTVSNAVADTIAPTVSASATGTSGSITLNASASDNVGVSKVEFYVDSLLKGTDTSSPYSLTIDSTTQANGNHTLTAKAYDAAGNVGTSSASTFSVNNASSIFTESESNGTAASANVVARTVGTITGTMGNTTDKDYFAISLNASEKLTLSMTGPTTADYDLYLVDAADTTLASSTGSTSTEALSYANTGAARTVYIKVISYSGSSTTVNYSVQVSYVPLPAAAQLLANSGFESGTVSWTATAGAITNNTGQAANTGTWKAWLDGYGAVHTDTVSQQVAIPATATTVTLSFWLKVVSSETTTTTAYDTLKAQVRNSAGTVLATLVTYSNLNKASSYLQKTFDLSAYKGQTVQIYFEGIEDSTIATSFLIDDVTLTAQ